MELTDKLRSAGIELSLVDGQIKVRSPKGLLTSTIIAEIQQNKEQLVPYLEEHGALTAEPQRFGYPVSPAQKRLWLMDHYQGGDTAYIISEILQLEGPLQPHLLSKAIQTVVSRHESFRTAIREDEFGDLKQFIYDTVQLDFQVEYLDVTQEDEQQLHHLFDTKLKQPFELQKAPLIRVSLMKRSAQHHFLLLMIHHAVADGWSVEVLKGEITQHYNHFLKQPGWRLPELKVQYRNYAYWLKNEQFRKNMEASGAYWREQFTPAAPTLTLPTPLPRPDVKTFNGTRVRHYFPEVFTQRLQQFTKSAEATLFMGLMAGLNGLFYRYSGHTDIVLGTPVANRNHPDLKMQIGLYVNTLAIRTRFAATDTFPTLLEKQKEVLQEGYTHQEYPFDQLVEELDIRRDHTRSPLFDVMVIFQNQNDLFQEGELHDIKISAYEGYAVNRSHFDLSFYFAQTGSQLYLDLEYNTDVFTAPFVHKLLEQFEIFVSNGIAFPSRSIAEIEYLSPEDTERLLYAHNPPLQPYVETQTLVSLLRKQAALSPDAVALVYEQQEVSYRELDTLSDQLAAYLVAEYGLGPGDYAGIKLPRTEWLLIAMIGVMKTGAAYVPLDLNYPASRIAWIETNSQCRVSVDAALIERFQHRPVTSVDAPQIAYSPASPAYLIYTSGSTGNPKGVVITHSSAAAFLDWCREEFSNTDFEVVLAATSHCFDLSIYEFFYPLTTGKRIRILESALYLKEYLKTERKVLINTVPSVMDALIKNEACFDEVVAVNLAGEPIPIQLSNTLVAYDFEFRNLYGPSEDTTYSTCYHITKQHQQSIPIGKPVSHTHVVVLSEGLALQGYNHLGEICLSGAGLARGYLGQEELTQEKFIPHPYLKDRLMYRTGDIGYWSSDGILMYVGRKDHQIKVRGFRIELGEIEFKLSEDPQVDNAVVLIREMEGEKQIVAYLAGEQINASRVHQELSTKLPGYMLPNYYALMSEIPKTPNGKVDKGVLGRQAMQRINTSCFEAARNETEERLQTIWMDYLSADRIGIHDNFFELGGHSLKMTKMLNDVHTRFSTKIPFELFLQDPTIESLALHIEHMQLATGSPTSSEHQQKIII